MSEVTPAPARKPVTVAAPNVNRLSRAREQEAKPSTAAPTLSPSDSSGTVPYPQIDPSKPWEALRTGGWQSIYLVSGNTDNPSEGASNGGAKPSAATHPSGALRVDWSDPDPEQQPVKAADKETPATRIEAQVNQSIKGLQALFTGATEETFAENKKMRQGILDLLNQGDHSSLIMKKLGMPDGDGGVHAIILDSLKKYIENPTENKLPNNPAWKEGTTIFNYLQSVLWMEA